MEVPIPSPPCSARAMTKFRRPSPGCTHLRRALPHPHPRSALSYLASQVALICSAAISLLIVPPGLAADGVPLCTATNDQDSPTIVSDGYGGTIVTWRDHRGGSYDIYAQRVSADGVALWTADGVALCTSANDQISPTITADGSGGAII